MPGCNRTVTLIIGEADSVQEHRAFGGRWQAAGVMLAEQAIPQSRHDAIAQITQWRRDDPQQCTECRPWAAERHQNSANRRRANVDGSVAKKNKRVESFAKLRRQGLSGQRALQGGKTQTSIRIVSQQPVDAVIAKSAQAIKEDDRKCVIEWFVCGRCRHGGQSNVSIGDMGMKIAARHRSNSGAPITAM